MSERSDTILYIREARIDKHPAVHLEAGGQPYNFYVEVHIRPPDCDAGEIRRRQVAGSQDEILTSVMQLYVNKRVCRVN